MLCNITLIPLYVLIYVCSLKINIHPRCCILNTLYELTPKSASQWPTQKPYKNHFLFQKECSQLCDFCRGADNASWVNCVCIIHARAIIFCTHNQTTSVINNIKKVFN